MRQGAGLLIALFFISMADGFGSILIGLLIIVGIYFCGLYLMTYVIDIKNKPKIASYDAIQKNIEVYNTREKRAELLDQWTWFLYEDEPSRRCVLWEWLDEFTTTKIKLFTLGDGLYYVGEVTFVEEWDDDYYDQPRVREFLSVIEGTDVKRVWDGTPLSKVPVSSIQKNIANSLKNDKNVRKILEGAYSNCQDTGSAVIELDDIDLDFTDKRVKTEFMKACLKTGNFSSVHMQKNGHQLKVFIDELDPI